MRNVTVFGTCRLDSLNNSNSNLLYNYNDRIKQEISYSYYTKEILEIIKFIKYNTLASEDTIRVFRSPMINKVGIYAENFKEIFKKTDIFIIEICSKKSYNYNNHYVHSVLDKFSNDEIASQIKVNIQSDEEIENDMIEIISELNNKKIIVVGHLVTYENGDRYELSKLLKHICLKNNILFIDPVKEITEKGYNITDLVINESKILHYNEKGHSIMKQIYEEYLNRLKYNTSQNNKNIEILINNKVLDTFVMKNMEYLFHQDYYLNLSGVHEYRLYSYLSTFFNDTIILDIGTSFGRSAIALSHNDRNKVITYDVYNWIQNNNHKIYSKNNVEFRLKNIIDDLTEEFISKCRLVIIDIDHFETMETIIMDKLNECKFSGIIILDDIYHPNKNMYEAMQRLWKNITIPKFDITPYGHSSGTGLILMNTDDIHLIFKN